MSDMFWIMSVALLSLLGVLIAFYLSLLCLFLLVMRRVRRAGLPVDDMSISAILLAFFELGGSR